VGYYLIDQGFSKLEQVSETRRRTFTTALPNMMAQFPLLAVRSPC
jgi:hypothetical protein